MRQIFSFRATVKAQHLDLIPSAIIPDMNTEPEPPEDLVSLYRRAFAEYGTRALWNMRPAEDPTPADALAITKALRTHGRMDGRRLAERIEELCRATR
jgi:hypothetical protein